MSSCSLLRFPGLSRCDGRGLARLEMVDVLKHIGFLVAALASECKPQCPLCLYLAGSKNMAEMMVVSRGAVATGTAEDQGATVLVSFGFGAVPDQIFSAQKALPTIPYAAGKLLLVEVEVFADLVSR
jgi:hypothetical protein